MAIDVTWPTPSIPVGIIHVPKADTELVELGPPERRKLDVNWLRGEVGSLWASEDGAPYSKPFIHNGEITVSGNVYARSVIFLDPYRIEFEDGQYTVRLVGANHNIDDVAVPNQVRLVTNLSAGLIRSTGVDEASVQSAMTAQGYTTVRAGKIDALDVDVSSRAMSGEGFSTEQDTRLTELHRIAGLDVAGPVVVSKTARMAPGVLQEVATAAGIVTITRKP